MEKIFFNGCIRTLDDAGCVAEAVGTKGKIAFIGTNEEAQKIPCEEKTDLQGRLLLPGACGYTSPHATLCVVERSVKLFDCKSVKRHWRQHIKGWKNMPESH